MWRLWRWWLRQWWMILDPVIVKNPELKEFFCKWWIMTKSRVEGRKNKFFLTQRVDKSGKNITWTKIVDMRHFCGFSGLAWEAIRFFKQQDIKGYRSSSFSDKYLTFQAEYFLPICFAKIRRCINLWTRQLPFWWGWYRKSVHCPDLHLQEDWRGTNFVNSLRTAFAESSLA